MESYMFPAYQKFYSSVSHLDNFNVEKSFFDNIASLDGFFSEYRNITFVMQKSLKHTPYMKKYEELRDKLLTDKWFVEKRNETIKQHPFNLVKEIEITIYYPSGKNSIWVESFSVENDNKLSDLLERIKAVLNTVHDIEVFFSAKFSYYEEDKHENVLMKCINGIHTMYEFMTSMYDEIGESCALCEELKQRIESMSWISTPLDMLLVQDYVYYPRTETFERASRIGVSFGHITNTKKLSIKDFCSHMSGAEHDTFKKFIVMHAIIGTTDLMPTIMVVYDDGYYTMDTFHTDIKTTFYRKVNEVAYKVSKENVREIYIMMTYVSPPLVLDFNSLSSSDRVSHGVRELLTFIYIDKYLNKKECYFEDNKIQDLEYIAKQINGSINADLEFGKMNMKPIVEAFKAKKQQEINAYRERYKLND